MDKQQEQVERSQKLDAAGAAAVPPPATSVPPPPPAGVQAPSGVDDFHTTLHGLTAALFQRFPDATARLEQLARCQLIAPDVVGMGRPHRVLTR